MNSCDLAGALSADLPDLRGTLASHVPLGPMTWFKAGGAAEVLFTPADEDDLAYVLSRLPADVPVTVIGLGSNLIVRDGGVPGVVVRLGRSFTGIEVDEDGRIRAGAAAPDVKVARTAAESAIDGLSFLRGIPGSIGGALPTNAGAHGGDMADVFVAATGIDRQGRRRQFVAADMGFGYRHCAVAGDIIFTDVTLAGRPGDPRRNFG